MANTNQGVTLVLGASDNSERYSYKAIKLLRAYKYDVVAIGAKASKVDDVEISTDIDNITTPIDTVTLYLNAQRQVAYIDAILKLKLRRVIFNPGTENEDFAAMLKEQNIQAIEACTLVMLRTNQY